MRQLAYGLKAGPADLVFSLHSVGGTTNYSVNIVGPAAFLLHCALLSVCLTLLILYIVAYSVLVIFVRYSALIISVT